MCFDVNTILGSWNVANNITCLNYNLKYYEQYKNTMGNIILLLECVWLQ